MRSKKPFQTLTAKQQLLSTYSEFDFTAYPSNHLEGLITGLYPRKMTQSLRLTIVAELLGRGIWNDALREASILDFCTHGRSTSGSCYGCYQSEKEEED